MARPRKSPWEWNCGSSAPKADTLTTRPMIWWLICHSSVWPGGAQEQFNYHFWMSWIFFFFFLKGLKLSAKKGRKPEYTKKTPGEKLKKMSCILAKNSSPKWNLVAGWKSRHVNPFMKGLMCFIIYFNKSWGLKIRSESRSKPVSEFWVIY